ncbi:hypothetical protein ACFQ0M_17060 [Kitasatospora aburaviensis]
MSTQPQPFGLDLDLDVVETRHHPIADPAACGTCWRLALAGQPTEHPACARRAVLIPAPDAPDYEDLADMTAEQKAALPTRFHTPPGRATPFRTRGSARSAGATAGLRGGPARRPSSTATRCSPRAPGHPR